VSLMYIEKAHGHFLDMFTSNKLMDFLDMYPLMIFLGRFIVPFESHIIESPPQSNVLKGLICRQMLVGEGT
jgi:hypothetical protein